VKTRGVQLQYSFLGEGQRGGDVSNPLFDLLQALREHGSIQHAARATGASYRHVWGQLKHWEEVLGEALVTWTQGQPARLTPFAERLLWAETRARARLTPHIEALRVELERVLAEALDGTQQVLAVWASHDLALPLLREHASRTHRLHVDLRFAGSMDALRALAEGRCVVAGFHVPPLSSSDNLFAAQLKPLLKPGRHKLIGGWRRVQGLMVAPGNPLGLHGLPGLAMPGVRFVNRQSGSGTRLLTEHLLDEQGLSTGGIAGFDATAELSHVAVAAAIAGAQADAGVGIESAAAQFGLGFVPLIEEDYFFVCLRDALDHPAVRLLSALLQTGRWRQDLSTLAGCTASPEAGQVLSLTRALPWWHFRGHKRG